MGGQSEADWYDWHTVHLYVHIDEHCEIYQFPNVPLNETFAELCRQGSHLSTFYDGAITTTLHGTAFARHGVLAARQVPQEPMYILLEQKFSPSFGFGTPDDAILPTLFTIDYVRLYQHVDATHPMRLQCSPPDHPTAEYILGHQLEYGVPPNSTECESTSLQDGFMCAADIESLTVALQLFFPFIASVAALIAVAGSTFLQGATSGIESIFLSAIIFIGLLRLLAPEAADIPEIAEPICFVLIHLPLSLCFALQSTTYKRSLSVLTIGVAFASWVVFLIFLYTDELQFLTFGLLAGILAALIIGLSCLSLVPQALLHALGAVCVGTLFFTLGVSGALKCEWIGPLFSPHVHLNCSDMSAGILSSSVSIFVIGLGLQLVVHAQRGALGRKSSRWGLDTRMFLLPFDYGRRTVAEHANSVELKRSFSALADPKPPASLALQPMPGLTEPGSDPWEGCTSLRRLDMLASRLCRVFGFQRASTRWQAVHMHALLRQLRSVSAEHAHGDKRSETEAARSLHLQLLQNYRRWCDAMGVHPRSCGVLTDCLLYLAIWGEAANLRHMPELLCWIYHRSLSFWGAIVSRDGSLGQLAASQSLLSGRRSELHLDAASPPASAAGAAARASRVTYGDTSPPGSAGGGGSGGERSPTCVSRTRSRTSSADAIRLVPGANIGLEQISERNESDGASTVGSVKGSFVDLAGLSAAEAAEGGVPAEATIEIAAMLVLEEAGDGATARQRRSTVGSMVSVGSALLDREPSAAAVASPQQAWLAQEEARAASAADGADAGAAPTPTPPSSPPSPFDGDERGSDAEGRSCEGAGVVCDDFLRRVVRPLYEVASQRMRNPEQPLTYDDINEFFWRSECLGYSVYRNGEHVAKALKTCQKTHGECTASASRAASPPTSTHACRQDSPIRIASPLSPLLARSREPLVAAPRRLLRGHLHAALRLGVVSDRPLLLHRRLGQQPAHLRAHHLDALPLRHLPLPPAPPRPMGRGEARARPHPRAAGVGAALAVHLRQRLGRPHVLGLGLLGLRNSRLQPVHLP